MSFPNFSGTDVCIPDCSVISAGAFYESVTLRSAAILGGSSIGGKAFNNCAYLESVTLPSGLTEIGEDAFLRCIKLKSITIPEGATSIGRQAFAHCRELTSVTIPDSVKECGEKAFDYCNENIQITFKGKTYKYDDLDNLYQDINNSNR